ncbi:MAG: hypothetical protein EOO95_01340 [Pedobacter sp.]|nr:MAG: hypothetical protein EOO95_01340 [Pedobacter sp.]
MHSGHHTLLRYERQHQRDINYHPRIPSIVPCRKHGPNHARGRISWGAPTRLLAPLSASFWVVYNETGENLFTLEKNGASLKKALDYLLYHNQHPEEWTWFKNPVTGNKDTATGFWPANLLEAMNGVYHSKDFDAFVAPYRPIMYPRHDYAWTYPTLFPLSLTEY